MLKETDPKVLYISYDGITDPLGQAQILPYLTKLAESRIKFSLVSFDKFGHREINKLRFMQQELGRHGIEWTCIRYHKKPKIMAKIYDITLGLFFCSFIIKKNKILMIHGRSFIGAFIGLILSKIFGIKFLLDYRGFWPDERLEAKPVPKKGFFYYLLKYLEKCLLLGADEIVVLTKKAKAAIGKFPYYENIRGQITVIPTCVDLERFKPCDNPAGYNNNGGIKIVYLGSLGTWYMLNEMTDFFSELYRNYPNSYFNFVSHTHDSVIDMAMKNRSIPKSRYSVSGVAYSEVPQHLGKANASIFFIKPVFSKISSCPTKLGESLACGLPVIINSGIGDCAEIINHNQVGVVVERFDEDAYKEALGRLETLLKQGPELSQRCRKVAEEYFSLTSGVASYRRIYTRLNQGTKI